MKKIVPSKEDEKHLEIIRRNVVEFMKWAAANYLRSGEGRLLDVAPQDHEGARPFFPRRIIIETLDIDSESGCTHIADICERNDQLILDKSYDYIVCTEVLEHTLRPFDAVGEIHRMLKPGGRLFISVPFNFRIHGPLPDCWRFTEHGLRSLLSDFEVLELRGVETSGRPLMPIHYTVVAERREGG